MQDTKVELLFVIANTEYGGGQGMFEIVAQALPREEFSLHVACDAKDPFWKRMGQLKVCRHEVRFDRSSQPLSVVQLAKVIRQERIRLVHSQSRRADFYALLAASLCRVPIISNVAIRTEHFDVSEVRKKLYRCIEAWMERHFDRQIAVSKVVEQSLLASGLPQEQVVYIPEAIDTAYLLTKVVSKQHACQRLGLDAQKYWVGTLGRLVPMKGQHIFLNAAAKLTDLPGVGFLLAGMGPLEEELKALAVRLQLGDRFQFLPFQEDPSDFYSALDLFVFPSIFSEAFPHVLTEAMAFAKPIIASNLPASISVLDDNCFARYVPPGDPEALARAIREMIQDPTRLQELGRLAQRYVTDHYDIHLFIQKIVDVYRSVLRSVPRPLR